MNRTGQIREVRIRLALYVLGGTVTAVLAGAVLGLIGATQLSAATRASLASLLGLAAIGLGLLELVGYRAPILQVNRETPYRWLQSGALGWSLRNGAAIGFGAGTRLGFWLWYVIPLGALLGASPLLGALGYGLYALTRTLGAGAILTLERTQRWTGLEIVQFSAEARRITSVQLIVIAAAAVAAFGF